MHLREKAGAANPDFAAGGLTSRAKPASIVFMPAASVSKPRSSNRYITRTETLDGTTRGWNVRLPAHRAPRRGGGKRAAAVPVRHSRFFADRKHGGKRPALVAARAFRDETLAELPAGNPLGHVGQMSRRNTSGIVGVRRGVYHDGVEGHAAYEFWAARWPNGRGGESNRSFSIALYGEHDAKRLAVMARREGVEELRIERGDRG